MAGYVIYNGFWNAAPPDPVQRLCAAGEAGRFPLSPLANTAVVMGVSGGVTVRTEQHRFGPGDTVIFWDKDVLLARALEQCGTLVCNSAAAVAVCDNKADTHLALAAAALPMPDTLFAPMTYREMNPAIAAAFCRAAEESFGYPLVLKECYGSFGGQVYLIRQREELFLRMRAMDSRPFLAQRFIAASKGRDVRLYVVGGRVEAAMERRSETDFRANIGNGGKGTAYAPSSEEASLAVRAAAAVGADFAGVDLLRGETGALICEVNSNAFMAGIIACTGVDIAARIVAYVKKKAGQ